MAQRLVHGISYFLESYLSPDVIIFLISAMPFLELRGGLIAAALWDIPWRFAVVCCVIGNMLPIPFIVLFIRSILDWMEGNRVLGKVGAHFKTKAENKAEMFAEKYSRRLKLGFLLLVATPLPLTGAWTCALAAGFLRMKLRDSIPAIFCGIILCACIMLVIAYFIPWIVN
ncbi:MAG: small multi-drug export protein [Oscillospiraceae bacterium]|nr:small multi-drug export protein [Oscillospiraceae bacterium]